MESINSIISEMNIGQILLLGFWGTCLVMFYSILLYVIYNAVKEGISKLFKKGKVSIWKLQS